MKSLLTLVRLCALAACLLLVRYSINSAEAQARTPTRVPVTVALVDNLPPGAGAGASLILRRASTEPHDLILLRASEANPQTLSAAVAHLMAIRGAMGDTATSDATLRVRSRASSPGQRRQEFSWAQRIVGKLRSAKEQDIPGLGRVPALQLWIPPQKK